MAHKVCISTHRFEFRNVRDTDEVVNAGLCAIMGESSKIEGSFLVGPQVGWQFDYIEASEDEDGSPGDMRIIVYVDRKKFVSSVIGFDGKVLSDVL